ncbi:MAG TPA: ferritin family protein [Thermodesulfobacteriota bacterium]|nr:ferritin family protein [Thermodesulfobacteriota bacterium]
MDPVHFSGKEVLTMAVRIEENGMRFYTDASKAAKSDSLKELFKVLAEEEAHHIKVFTELRSLVAEDTVNEGFDPQLGEASLYLKSIADTEVFTKPDHGKEFAKRVHDEKEALKIAIDMEKDSLLFYYELQRLIRAKDKAVIESLIEQEKEHVRKLTEAQTSLYGA